MNELNSGQGKWAANTAKNTRLLGYWTGAWLITMALATFGPIFIWESNKLISFTAILINLAVGVGMILANIRHLKGLDEMHQKVQLQAMGLSLGVAIVAGLGYSMLDVSNVISSDAEISHLIFLIGITYAIGITTGLRKYR